MSFQTAAEALNIAGLALQDAALELREITIPDPAPGPGPDPDPPGAEIERLFRRPFPDAWCRRPLPLGLRAEGFTQGRGRAVHFNFRAWSYELLLATSADPLVMCSDRAKSLQLRIPPSAVPSAGSGGGTDGHMMIMQPTGMVAELWTATRLAPDVIQAGRIELTNARGTAHEAGTLANGTPATAVMPVRAWELEAAAAGEPAMERVLPLLMYPAWMTRGPVAPADEEDGNSATAYKGQAGEAGRMGSRFRYDPTFPVETIADPVVRDYARCAQLFGFYLCDSAGNYTSRIESSADPALADRLTSGVFELHRANPGLMLWVPPQPGIPV